MRGQQVVDWMKSTDTDLLFMQEIKSIDENFPADLFKEAGFETYIHGQKTYNGVAIASRRPLGDVRKGLPRLKDSMEDEQSRYIECDVAGVTIGGLYMPNGNPVKDDNGSLHTKFTYKLDWMKRLVAHADAMNSDGRTMVFCGDFNIIPEDSDCWDISRWHGDALHHPDTLAAYRKMLYLGYTEIWRAYHPNEVAYSFWDYQGGAWQKDHGLRIDHILANAEATDLFTACNIDKSPRGNDKASDHTPIWAEISIDS
jgi:exodeoxyribonuclease-3